MPYAEPVFSRWRKLTSYPRLRVTTTAMVKIGSFELAGYPYVSVNRPTRPGLAGSTRDGAVFDRQRAD